MYVCIAFLWKNIKTKANNNNSNTNNQYLSTVLKE